MRLSQLVGYNFIFCMSFEEKYFFCYIILTDQISLPVFLLHKILGNICIVNQAMTS